MRLNQPTQIPAGFSSMVRNGDIPPFEVTQAADHPNGPISILSPPPHQLEKSTPRAPVPKGKPGLYLVRLDDLAKKEITLIDVNNRPTGMNRDGVPMNNVGVALKRKNETQD